MQSLHANGKILNHINNMRNSHYQIFFAVIKETASAQQTQPRLLCSIAISLPLANVTSPGKLPIWLEIPRFITPIDKEFSFLCIFTARKKIRYQQK